MDDQLVKRLWKHMKAIEKVTMGINQRNLELVYPSNSRKDFPLADDKTLTKEILTKHNIPCAETYEIIHTVGSIRDKWHGVHDLENMVIKPAKGSGGGGILLLRKIDDAWHSGGIKISEQQVFQHLANIVFGVFSFGSNDKAIIEERIIPHPFFKEIYPQGVSDFRIILYKDEPVMAMLRVPTDQSGGRANLHQKAIGIGIDIENGTLQYGFDSKTYLKAHPDTDFPFFECPIPAWEEILSVSIQTSKAFPLNYLGIDIVLNEQQRPLVMEINARPGIEIQNVNRKGLKEIIRKQI